MGVKSLLTNVINKMVFLNEGFPNHCVSSVSEFPHKTGVLWSERHWSEAGNSDSYKMGAASPGRDNI